MRQFLAVSLTAGFFLLFVSACGSVTKTVTNSPSPTTTEQDLGPTADEAANEIQTKVQANFTDSGDTDTTVEVNCTKLSSSRMTCIGIGHTSYGDIYQRYVVEVNPSTGEYTWYSEGDAVTKPSDPSTDGY